jgi:hypothetical protein
VNVGQYIAILQAFGGIDLNADGRFLHAANLDERYACESFRTKMVSA